MVVVACERYERDRREMIPVILTELGQWRRQEGNGCRYCWDVVETRKMNEWMIEAMKFLERVWFVRCRDNKCTRYCFFYFSVYFLSLSSLEVAVKKDRLWSKDIISLKRS